MKPEPSTRYRASAVFSAAAGSTAASGEGAAGVSVWGASLMGKHIAWSGVPVDTVAVNCGLPEDRKTDRDCTGDIVRVAQQDRAQDSLLQNWALRRETSQRIRSKSGKARVPLGTLPIPSQAPPTG